MTSDSDFRTILFTAALRRMPPERRAAYMSAHGFGFLNEGKESRQVCPKSLPAATDSMREENPGVPGSAA